jgi:hypothetical protein
VVPQGSARSAPQMLSNLLGKVLRIAPSAAGTGSGYAITSDTRSLARPAPAAKSTPTASATRTA